MSEVLKSKSRSRMPKSKTLLRIGLGISFATLSTTAYDAYVNVRPEYNKSKSDAITSFPPPKAEELVFARTTESEYKNRIDGLIDQGNLEEVHRLSSSDSSERKVFDFARKILDKQQKSEDAENKARDEITEKVGLPRLLADSFLIVGGAASTLACSIYGFLDAQKKYR